MIAGLVAAVCAMALDVVALTYLVMYVVGHLVACHHTAPQAAILPFLRPRYSGDDDDHCEAS